MAALGSGINAGLGRIDYSPIARGGEAAARGIMGAANTRAQGVMAIGQGISQGIQKFQQKKEENKMMENAQSILKNLWEENPAGAKQLGLNPGDDGVWDAKELRAAVEGAGGPGQIMNLGVMMQRMRMEQEEATRQAVIADSQNKLRADQGALARAQAVAMGVPDPVKGIRYESREAAESDLRVRNQTGTIYQDQSGWVATNVRPNSERPAFRTPEEEARAVELSGISKSATEFNESVLNDATNSNRRIAELKRAKKLLETVDTGFGTETINQAKKIVNKLGIDVDLDRIASIEQLQVLFGNEMMGRIQETRGSISNQEMDKFADISPDLSKTNPGNNLILDFALAVEERKPRLARYIGKLRAEKKPEPEIRAAIDDWLNAPENSLISILPPPGVDPADWAYMSDEDKALFN